MPETTNPSTAKRHKPQNRVGREVRKPRAGVNVNCLGKRIGGTGRGKTRGRNKAVNTEVSPDAAQDEEHNRRKGGERAHHGGAALQVIFGS